MTTATVTRISSPIMRFCGAALRNRVGSSPLKSASVRIGYLCRENISSYNGPPPFLLLRAVTGDADFRRGLVDEDIRPGLQIANQEIRVGCEHTAQVQRMLAVILDDQLASAVAIELFRNLGQ